MPATEPAHAKCTIWGVLLHHRGHELSPSSGYVAPPGRVYGAPHVYLDCRTCGIRVWDEDLSTPDAPRGLPDPLLESTPWEGNPHLAVRHGLIHDTRYDRKPGGNQ